MSSPTLVAPLPPRFELVRELGTGGMGVVLEVVDRDRGEHVALKTLRESSPEAIFRLKREFRLLAELHHPGLIRLHELFVEDETCFFTMDLIRGRDIFAHATRDAQAGSLREPAATAAILRRLLGQLADVLDFLHDAGHVHRDLKPSNILVTDDERLTVLDFGLVEDTYRSNLDGVVGTAGYMAPEQCTEQPVDSAADWYSVGCILHQVLTGRLPYAGTLPQIIAAQRRGPPPLPSSAIADADPELTELTSALLTAEPTARPSSDQIRQRLELAAASGARVGDAPSQHSVHSAAGAFLGRDHELEVLETSLTRLVAGWRGAVAIFGASGLGKTTLLRHFVRVSARRHDDLVCLRGRCFERESVSYQALDALIDELSSFWRDLSDEEATSILPEEPSLLSRLFPVLGRVRVVADSPPMRVSADPSDLRSRGFAALRDVLRRIAERRPLVIMLDDMQWADANTLDLLADVVRPPRPPNVLLVMSSRPSGRERIEAWLPQLELETECLDLGPLEMKVCVQFALDQLGKGSALAPAAARESGGVPFFLHELVRHAAHREDASLAGVSLQDLLRARIAEMPDASVRLLEVLSVIGEPTTRAVLSAAADSSSGELHRDLGPLAANRLVRLSGRRPSDTVELYHDSIRELVIAALDGPRRRQVHRRVALALVEVREDESHLLARHWLAAGEHGRAAEHARVGAGHAADRLDFISAAELYALAIAYGEWPADVRRQLLYELGSAQSRAGLPSEAAESFSLAAEAEPGELALDMRRRAAEELLRGGYLDEGLEALRLVLATTGTRLAKTPRRAFMSLAWRRAWLRLRGLRQRKARPGENAPERLTRIDVYNTVAMGLAIVDAVRGAEFQARSLLASLRSGDAERTARALAVEAGYLAAQGAGGRALRVGERAKQLADEVGGSLVQAYVAWGFDGFHAFYITNRWRDAVEHLANSERLFRAGVLDAGWEIDTVRMYSCFSLLYLGDLTTLSSCVPTYVREAERRGDLYWAVSLRTRLYIVWLVKDDVARGVRDVDDAIASWAPWEDGFQVQHFFAVHGRCELALYQGDAVAASEHLQRGLPGLRRSLLLHVTMVGLEVTHLQGRVSAAAAAHTDGAERARHLRTLRRVVKTLRRHPQPVARAMAPLLSAAAAQLSGDVAGAIAGLREGIDALDALETHLYAAAARLRLSELEQGVAAGRYRAEAMTYFDEHGVVAPDKLTAMLVPGW